MTERTEITLEELADLPEGTRLLIDTRDEISMSYGTIPGAKHIPDLLEQAERGTLPKDRSLILFCMHGTQSLALAENLQDLGYQAFSLKNGYGAWLRKNLTPADRSAEIENAIRRVRRFHEKLMTPFTKAIREYQLLQPGDRVAVCISGGKDSMLMAKLFQELQRHRKFPFELKFLVMDPGYNELNRLMIETNAAALGIPITIFETNIFDIVDGIPNSPCYLCARMRRGHLYRQAKELGCNKIALGHHYDDVIETILMGMLWSGQFQTMMPKVHSQNFEGMELIRPMSLIREEDIPEEGPLQLDLFTDYETIEKQRREEQAKLDKERRMQEAQLKIKKRFGKNAILRGLNFEEGATAKERNEQIGGHKA